MYRLIFLLIIFGASRLLGINYEYISDGYFTSVHVLIVNPNEQMIMPVRAEGDEVKRETVFTLAERHQAVAAINGGFWKQNGDPAGALKIDNHWLGTPIKPRGAIGWSLINPKVLIDKILTNCSLSDAISDSQIEVIPVSDPSYTTPEEWKELEHIVGGTPVLVQNGNLIEDFSSEKTLQSFLTNKHPRTAVGIKSNGDWVFVVVDGRFYGYFGGMTMNELAQLMLDLGCVEALNLDGGSSTTMVFEGKVINDPCGTIEEEEKFVEEVSDAILIF